MPIPNNKDKRYRLSVFVSVVVVLLFFLFLYLNWQQLSRLMRFDPWTVFYIFILVLIVHVSRGVINLFFYRKFDVFMTLYETIALAIVNTLGNLLPLSGGLIAKGYYLKKKYDFPYKKYFPATMALYVCFVSVNGLAGLLILCTYALVDVPRPSIVLYISFSTMAFSIFLLWVPQSIIKKFPGRIIQKIQSMEEGWVILSRNRLLLMLIIILQLLILAANSLKFYLLFPFFSITFSYSTCVLFASSLILTRLLTVTPGSLGTQEVIVATISSLFGESFGVSAVVVALDRLLTIGFTCVLWIVLTVIWGKKLNITKRI